MTVIFASRHAADRVGVGMSLQCYYGAEISALSINDNVLKMVVNPGEQVDAPCRLSLAPANSYLVVNNRTRTIVNGGTKA